MSVFDFRQNLFFIDLNNEKYERWSKNPVTIVGLFTWVHLYKDASVYIKYEPSSVVPRNMVSIACLVALQD